MIRSMYAGITGMKNFQTKLDVIGNNIANVNTYGFKKGRVTFKDMVSQTISSASAPTAGKGGVNPQQVGLGSQLATIDTIDTQGSLQTTGRVLDVAIQGDGYLVVAEGTPSGESFFQTSTYYTRAGNLYLNSEGYVVTGAGQYVLATNPSTGDLQPISINGGNIQEVQSFSISQDGKISFIKSSPLTSIDKAQEIIGTIVATTKNLIDDPTSKKHVDSLAKLTEQFELIANDAQEEAKLLTVEAENLLAIAQANGDPREITAANDALARATNAETAITDMINSINQVQSAFTSIDNAFNTYQGSPTTANEQAIIDAGIAALAINNGVATQAATAGTNVTDTKDAIDYIHAMQLDLIKEGDLYTTSYSIAIARFANNGGLQKVGENMFAQTASSGAATYLTPGIEGAGSVVSGSLEMSNVDLSEEFAEMIVAQRGFQANTRIITTSDEILQELINLKR
ncbi:flagellar hook-basal body complex protein [Lederbergia graminis]|uniref:Flagellar hook protein FlgE n=1 Tax=Lederbergia graminis TaxID=735518 RepID=A0ABW0LD02_9BACI